ncbi:GNAT family N-acetyltransferase [Alkalibacterium iburiense]|uniref:GNAT family N-acetyltransferase n=1 Tax=Alkalibacterium iburiense TaxID=290589 RepID=A0ABN0XR97_9LACT
MRIRKAKQSDAEDIAKVHVDSWRTTYKGIISDKFLNQLSYDRRTELWQGNISKEDTYILVVENSEGQIVGFADAWKRETNIVPYSIDLTSIYLLEDYQGKGIGKMLIRELFTYFKEKGYEKVFVDVLEENKSRYFYEHYGAKHIKSVEIKIGDALLNEFIYEWNDLDCALEKLNA